MLCLQVSLDLASFEVVNNNHATLLRWMTEGLLDLVFCNLEEAEALAKVTPHPPKHLPWTYGHSSSTTRSAVEPVQSKVDLRPLRYCQTSSPAQCKTLCRCSCIMCCLALQVFRLPEHSSGEDDLLQALARKVTGHCEVSCLKRPCSLCQVAWLLHRKAVKPVSGATCRLAEQLC